MPRTILVGVGTQWVGAEPFGQRGDLGFAQYLARGGSTQIGAESRSAHDAHPQRATVPSMICALAALLGAEGMPAAAVFSVRSVSARCAGCGNRFPLPHGAAQSRSADQAVSR
ncbi:hypothetical protein GCM10023318_60110 [Nocardia callitridis]|uniref:Beta-ketoacyl synthase N-terminal domain-containing protein n=1 Tax=Nocardia callitridis TaxID=648753 RepID=A0ABP9L4F0_9NOCA